MVRPLSAVKSRLALAMLHAFKAVAWPEHPAVEHWQQEVTTFLSNAQTTSQPGMQQHVDPAALYARALKSLRKLPPPGGVSPGPLPEMVASTAAESSLSRAGTNASSTNPIKPRATSAPGAS